MYSGKTERVAVGRDPGLRSIRRSEADISGPCCIIRAGAVQDLPVFWCIDQGDEAADARISQHLPV